MKLHIKKFCWRCRYAWLLFRCNQSVLDAWEMSGEAQTMLGWYWHSVEVDELETLLMVMEVERFLDETAH